MGEPEREVEHVFLVLAGTLQHVVPFRIDDYMAGRAGERTLAGALEIDVVAMGDFQHGEPERRLDFDALAEKFELTGGFIKVACERAAYVAGANGVDIDEPLLRATIERMYRERGKLSTVGPLE